MDATGASVATDSISNPSAVGVYVGIDTLAVVGVVLGIDEGIDDMVGTAVIVGLSVGTCDTVGALDAVGKAVEGWSTLRETNEHYNR